MVFFISNEFIFLNNLKLKQTLYLFLLFVAHF